MLTHLVIRNFAIIEHLEIPFHRGFTVLSGETGAGKSIIIDALNLLLGGRASTGVIRTDEEEAVVEGVFEPRVAICGRINAVLESQGIETASQLIIRRIVSRSGRNKIFINGSLASVAALAELTRGLVDISGQHEHYSLLQADGHINTLDGFAELAALRDDMRAAYDEVSAVQRKLSELRDNVRDRLHRIDFLSYQLSELDAAKLVSGEEDKLNEEFHRLRNAEKIGESVGRAMTLCYDSDGSAAEQLAEAVMLLEGIIGFEPQLEACVGRLQEARILTEDVARELRDLSGADAAPGRLDKVIARLEVIKKLRRKHGGTIDDMLRTSKEMRKELNDLENSEERGQELEEELQKARARAFVVAHDLSTARRAAAVSLRERIEAELEELNMARTQFVVNFMPEELPRASDLDATDDGEGLRLGARGFDQVEFMLAANVGEAPKPLSKIASGGELSRIMLAIKGVLMERDTIDTYVFDEVDTGIGGSTADVVGQKIQRTSLDHQVLCITHLPQIASRSDHHYMVEKVLVGDRTQSTIRPLPEDERVEEIARMLGGTRVTSKTRDAARELLTSKA